MTTYRNQLLGAGAVLVVTGLLANARTPWALERTIGQWIYDWPDWFETPLKVVMQVGGFTAIVVVAAGLVVAGRYRAAGAAALAGVAAWVVGNLLKRWLDRPRPSLPTLGRVPRDIIDGFAWPSGHASVAAALGTVLLMTVADRRVARLVVAAAVLLTGIARIYLGAHWTLDVLGGFALGTIAGTLAVQVAKP